AAGDSPSSRGGQTSGGQAREREERNRKQLAQALESVNKALKDMQSASGGGTGDPQKANQSAQEASKEASRDLRRAVQQMDQPEQSRFDETLEQFADRSQRMLDEQHRIESELYDSLAQAAQSPSANTRGGIDQRRAQD